MFLLKKIGAKIGARIGAAFKKIGARIGARNHTNWGMHAGAELCQMAPGGTRPGLESFWVSYNKSMAKR